MTYHININLFLTTSDQILYSSNSAQLISLFTSPNIGLKTQSAQVYFIIAKQKTDRFIHFTGYGNGAGLLYDAGILAEKRTHLRRV